jgi:hypothetical protein
MSIDDRWWLKGPPEPNDEEEQDSMTLSKEQKENEILEQIEEQEEVTSE